MGENFYYGQNVNLKLQDGIAALNRLLAPCYGPKGTAMVLDGGEMVPVLVKSGNGLMQELQNGETGGTLLRTTLEKMSETRGDGTIITSILTDALIKEAIRLVEAGENPVQLRKEMNEEAERIQSYIKDRSVEIEDIEKAVSVGGSLDEKERELLCLAFQNVKQDGIITVKDTKKSESHVEIIDCMEIDQGYLSEEMITDIPSREAVLEYPYILLTDQVISNSDDLIPAMTIAKKAGKPLFIMAQDVTGEALATLVVNNRNGKVQSAAVKATAYGERRKEILWDITSAAGGVVIVSELGLRLRDITADMFGNAEQIKVTASHTFFYSPKGDSKAKADRIIRLEQEMKNTPYEVDRVNLKNRLARLNGNVSTIYVGADTDLEMRSKRQKIRSSIAGTKAILKGGAVAGGGITLYNAARDLYGDQNPKNKIYRAMLTAPLKQLIRNGEAEPEKIISKLDEQPDGYGYDLENNQFCSMLDAGIVDAADTLCDAVKIAISLAGLVITTGTLVMSGYAGQINKNKA